MPKPSSRISALFLFLTPIAYGATMKTPDIKLNPNPRMRYEVTVRIQDAPGPFDTIDGTVDYRVSNEDCVPLTPVTGATVLPSKRVPLKLTAIGDNTYRGELFADLLQDEDYFGKGICHWSVVAAGVEARIKRMDFAASLPKDHLFAHKAIVQYYSNRAYVESDTELLNTGNLNRDDFKDPAHTFSISLSAEEKIQ